ncbi:MAG: Crp/Fnr family transcriptional regulator [Acutalibacteraceae bacterium]|nr:Crp/Fnr family transcriptional regulator [Acutalibacteraceae bacterium]
MQEKLMLELINAAKNYYNINMTIGDAKQLMSIASVVQYKTGDILCDVGDSFAKTGFILDGLVRSAFLTYNGKDITRYFHTKYSMVMDDCLLGFKESKYRCEALVDSLVLMFSVEKLKNLIQENAVFREVYTKSLEMGLRYKIYRENELMTKNATERYLQFVKDFPDLIKYAKQCDIATYLGIEPQSLSRIKRQLKN